MESHLHHFHHAAGLSSKEYDSWSYDGSHSTTL